VSESRRIPWLAILPLAAFVALAGLFFVRLYSGDPSRLPSALIGKQVPNFTLPAIEGAPGPGFSNADLAKGDVTLVNVFASWCVPCREEHPLLMQMAKDPALKAMGVRLFGLNYKDEAQNARGFIAQYGNPYDRMGADLAGRAGIDFGVYGVPETFVVRGDGTIAYKQIGPITPDDLRNKLMPAIEAAVKASRGGKSS
jgi:cytochrome c biogenesis protein CcmG/thiol:disulfide interchange protein DsbE